jgi:hypothetical protein
MGDSSLDNKYWLYPDASSKSDSSLKDESFCGDAENGYEHILEPPRGIRDVAWHLNHELARLGSEYACINAAVEESTTSDRDNGVLLEQDLFVQRNLRNGDLIIVSLGGNDIALRPTKATMAAIGSLNFLTPQFMAKRGYGLGFGHLGTIFKDSIENYLKRVVGETKPALIVPCTIYYPCEHDTGSWADTLLNTLGCNDFEFPFLSLFSHFYSFFEVLDTNSPTKLKMLIDACFEHFTKKIQVFDVPMHALALSSVLDSTDEKDYDNRVEPSVQGGAKMGARFAQVVTEFLHVSKDKN